MPRQGGRLGGSQGYSDGRYRSGSRGNNRRYGFGSGYQYNSRFGFRPGYGGYGARYGNYRHVHLPGYTYPSIYGSFFYFPGYAFNVGIGHGCSNYYGRGYSGYGYNPYGYGYSYYPTNYADLYTGFLRLKIRPQDGQVFVDGYYVGIVNEFDGIFQRLRLEEGPHHVEIRHPAYLPLEFEVLIVVGEKVTYEGELYRR